MTPQEYRLRPNHCPLCDSTDLEGDGSDHSDGEWHTYGVLCNACDATWDDAYELIGYVNLVQGKPN